MARTLAALALLFLSSARLAALEVRFQPGERLYVYENRGEGSPADLYTAVIQNLAFAHVGDEPVTLDRAWVEAHANGTLIHRELISHEALSAAAKTYSAYQQQGVLEAYDFHFQTSRYLEGFGLPAGLTLTDRQAVLVKGWALLVHGLPERILVRVEGHDPDGEPVVAEASLRVVDHHSANTYLFPVRGRWVAAAAPSLHSHHRWASIQEFALDLVQFGDQGLTHAGDGSRLDQYFAYGKPIYSVAAGVVVAASDGMEESDANLRRPEETISAYEQRMMVDQQRLLAGGFAKVMGNHLVIRHANDEYSHFAHLRNGSLLVKEGQSVTAGQKIAALGHSGNSTEPHLHLHMTDGPDIVYSRSIPVAFSGITLWPSDDGSVRHLHSGQVVISEP